MTRNPPDPGCEAFGTPREASEGLQGSGRAWAAHGDHGEGDQRRVLAGEQPALLQEGRRPAPDAEELPHVPAVGDDREAHAAVPHGRQARGEAEGAAQGERQGPHGDQQEDQDAAQRRGDGGEEDDEPPGLVLRESGRSGFSRRSVS
jgi:hypothetical protein